MQDDLIHLNISHSLDIVEINTYFSPPEDSGIVTDWNNYITSTDFIRTIKGLISKGKTIILDGTMEGSLPHYAILRYLNLLQANNVDFSKVFLAFNNSKLDPSVNKQFGGFNIRSIFFPHFLISTCYKFDFFDFRVLDKTKYDFLCLNRRMRNGKLLLLNELQERNLLDNTLYSYVSDNTNTLNTEIQKKQPDGDLDYGSHIANDDTKFLYGFNSKWYSSCKVEIVNETYYFEEDQCHMTEKIFKSILMEKPFVVNSTKGFLEELKKLGFKTFSSVIDESYDNADNEVRYKRVVDAAQELLKYYDDPRVKEICRYNRRLLLSIDHKKKIVEEVFIKKLNKQYEQLTPRRI